jgi:hypothetical protein
MFTQVVGTLFRLAHENESQWREVVGSKDVPVVGAIEPVEPEAVPADSAKLRAKYEATAPAQKALWDEILSAPVPLAMGPDAWARVVFDFLETALRQPGRSEELARGLLPLYYKRVAEFIDEARNLNTQESEDIVEVGALAMEKEKEDHVESEEESAKA